MRREGRGGRRGCEATAGVREREFSDVRSCHNAGAFVRGGGVMVFLFGRRTASIIHS